MQRILALKDFNSREVKSKTLPQRAQRKRRGRRMNGKGKLASAAGK